MNNLFSLTLNTLRETLRDPIFFMLLLFAMIFIGLFPGMALFMISDEIKFIVDSGMATILTFGLLAAVLSSSNTVNREMRNGTVLLLMSKPVNRVVFVLSKIIGVSIALMFFVFICISSTIFSIGVFLDMENFVCGYLYIGVILFAFIFSGVRNYYKGTPFGANCVYVLLVTMPIIVYFFGSMSGAIDFSSLLIALALLFCAVILMGAITVLLAIKYDLVVNMFLSMTIFLGGLLSSYFVKVSSDITILGPVVKLFSYIIPNWQFFWLADALTKRSEIPLSYLGMNIVYALVYLALCSYWAISLFDKRELAKTVE